MKTTNRILEFITAQNRLVTLKEIQDELGLKPSVVAGFLVALCRSNRLTREKIDRGAGKSGPKMRWAYKPVASAQQNG